MLEYNTYKLAPEEKDQIRKRNAKIGFTLEKLIELKHEEFRGDQRRIGSRRKKPIEY